MVTAALLGVILAGFAAAFLAPGGLGRPTAFFLCTLAVLITIPLDVPEEPIYRGAWATLYAVFSGLFFSEALATYLALKTMPEEADKSSSDGTDSGGEDGSKARRASKGMHTRIGYRERITRGETVIDFVLGSLMLGMAMGIVF